MRGESSRVTFFFSEGYTIQSLVTKRYQCEIFICCFLLTFDLLKNIFYWAVILQIFVITVCKTKQEKPDNWKQDTWIVFVLSIASLSLFYKAHSNKLTEMLPSTRISLDFAFLAMFSNEPKPAVPCHEQQHLYFILCLLHHLVNGTFLNIHYFCNYYWYLPGVWRHDTAISMLFVQLVLNMVYYS